MWERNGYVSDRRARQSRAELQKNTAQRRLSGAGQAGGPAQRPHQNKGLFRAVRRGKDRRRTRDPHEAADLYEP